MLLRAMVQLVRIDACSRFILILHSFCDGIAYLAGIETLENNLPLDRWQFTPA